MNEALDTRPRRSGGVTQLLLLPFTVLGLLCAALLLRLLLEGLGMLFVWSDIAKWHAQSVYEHDLHYLAGTPGAARWQSLSYAWRKTKSSLQRTTLSAYRIGIRHASHSLPCLSEHRASIALRVSKQSQLHTALAAAQYSGLSIGVRALNLCQALPLLVLSLLVGVIDGWVRRHVRRFNTQRESSYVHHRARVLFVPLTLLPGVAYLVLPLSLSPSGFIVASAAGVAGMATLVVGSFKKHL